MKKLLIPGLLVLIFALLWSGFDQNSITASWFQRGEPVPEQESLESRIAMAESRLEYLEQQEALRIENDQFMFVSDADEFLARTGLLFEQEPVAVDMMRIIDSSGKESGSGATYKFSESPVLVDDSGNRFPLDIHKGETAHLLAYTEGNVTQLAYYACYTNSAMCYVETKVLPIAMSY